MSQRDPDPSIQQQGPSAGNGPGTQRPLHDQRYAVPFGRFTPGGESEPPSDEVLVGREGQRAYLIDTLIGMGRQGAYLVTGRRGAGKSAFVQHCIREYEESVFERYLRGNVGRSMWDLLTLVALLLILFVGATLLAEYLAVLMFGTTGSTSTRHRLLVALLSAPVAVLCLYPIAYAYQILAAVADWLRSSLPSLLRSPPCLSDKETSTTREAAPPPPISEGVRLVTFVVTALLAAGLWYRGPMDRPDEAMSRMAFAASAIYAIAEALDLLLGSVPAYCAWRSYRGRHKDRQDGAGITAPDASLSAIETRMDRLGVVLRGLACGWATYFVCLGGSPGTSGNSVDVLGIDFDPVVLQNLLTAGYFGAAAVFVAAVRQHLMFPRDVGARTQQVGPARLGKYSYLTLGAQLVVAALLGAHSLEIHLPPDSWKALAVLAGVVLLGCLLHQHSVHKLRKLQCTLDRSHWLRRQAHPGLVLYMKAVASILVALFLSYPVLSAVFPRASGPPTASAPVDSAPAASDSPQTNTSACAVLDVTPTNCAVTADSYLQTAMASYGDLHRQL